MSLLNHSSVWRPISMTFRDRLFTLLGSPPNIVYHPSHSHSHPRQLYAHWWFYSCLTLGTSIITQWDTVDGLQSLHAYREVPSILVDTDMFHPFFRAYYTLLSSSRATTTQHTCRFSVTKSCLTPWPHGLQCARLLCPSPSLRICSNSCSLSWWCYSTFSSSVALFCSLAKVYASERMPRLV